MERAQAISTQRLARRVGKAARVLIDRIDNGVAIARSEGDAPDIDGVVRIKSHSKSLRAGEFADVKITAADAYDLEAELPN
jgi:ribosomal protein S12 methylthiotransferase